MEEGKGGVKDAIKVEIWSDVMCPFCYIGKRRFEAALDRENLVRIGTDAGLDEAEVRAVLESGAFAAEVRGDILEARRIGSAVHGHPDGGMSDEDFVRDQDLVRADLLALRDILPAPSR